MSNEELEVVPTTDPAPAADPVDTAVTDADASAAATQAVADVITAATGTEPDEEDDTDEEDDDTDEEDDDTDEDEEDDSEE